MASWFTRALDRITPWDRGGEVQRREERRRREEEERRQQPPRTSSGPSISVGVAQPTERIAQTPQVPTPQRPENLFRDLSGAITRGISNTVRVARDPDTDPAVTPEPGTVIQPRIRTGVATDNRQISIPEGRALRIQKPEQSFGNKIRDIFDADTEADRYRRISRRTDELESEMRARGVSPDEARQDAIRIAHSTDRAPYRGIDQIRDVITGVGRNLIVDSAKGVARGTKATATNPIESGRILMAQATGNREAERMAEYRRDVAMYGKDVADKLARGENLSGWDALEAGANIISVAPAVGGLRMGARGLRSAMATGSVRPAVRGVVAGADEALLGVRDLRNIFRRPQNAVNVAEREPIRIPVTEARDIPVTQVQDIPITQVGGPRPVRVRNMDEPQPLIREVTGDASVATPDPLVQRFADEVREEAAIAANNASRPSREALDRFEGVTPRESQTPYNIDPIEAANTQNRLIDEYAEFLRSVGEGNGTQLVPDGQGGYFRTSNNMRFGDTKGKRMTKAAWREEAERQLRAGEADPSIQRAFDEANDPEVQSLLVRGEQPEAPQGRPIEVTEERNIPVTDESVVPIDEGTPSTVRATTRTDTNAARTQAAAEAQAQTPAPTVTPEVQHILDNPKQYNKRQVAAARSQRRLARQYAKAQEEVSEAYIRSQNAIQGRVSGEGFAPTGEFRTGRNRNVYEAASNVAEESRARSAVANQSADDLIAELAGKSEFTQYDVARMDAIRQRLMQEPGFQRRDDFRILDELYKQAGTQRGQGLALYNRILRRNATGDRLANQWFNRVSKITDTTKISDADLESVRRANNNFTQLRDMEVRLEEQYLRTGSERDFNAWQDAYRKAAQADIDAKTTELKAAKNATKGSKNENVAKVISDMEREADLNMMDHLTASQLSGPATGARNLLGTELAGIENRLFANTRAAITNRLFGENVGGYNRAAARAGRKEGAKKFSNDILRRSSYSGKNPLKHAQNWATSVNSMGDVSLYSQARSRLGAYYRKQLKDAGYSGKDLNMRVNHAMAKDPDEMAGVFLDSSMKSSGLTGLYQKTQTIEKALSDIVEGQLAKAVSPKAAKSIAKGLTRLTVGYPTATANFVAQSSKRAAAGVPSFLETGYKLVRGDKRGAAMAFDRALKEAGSGAAMWGAGMALNQAGLVSGFYPEDKDERQRWADEGITELSINIGGRWYPIPTQFGMLGLPILLGATYNEGGVDEVVNSFANRKNLAKLLPADQAYGVLQVLSGDATANQDKGFVASAIRSLIPAGSLLAQTAKGLDPTADDTSSRSFWRNVFDQVVSGIPVANNMVDIPDKLSSTGESIRNPNLLEVYSGARSVEQESGIRNSQRIDQEINDRVSAIDRYGLLDDNNLQGVLEGKSLEAYNKVKNGQQLDESDIKSLQEGLVKGVELSGTDTAYLEREQYDTNLAVLQLKRDLAQSDPTTKPSSLEKLNLAIKRGEIYKEHQVPYEMIKSYQTIGLEDWRKMGIPPGQRGHDPDMYDPDMYEQLYQLDQLMTEDEAGYGKRGKPKYYLKTTGSGSGRGGSRRISTDFGKLGSFRGAPTVRQYETINVQSGGVPRIRQTIPNIVHRVSVRG